MIEVLEEHVLSCATAYLEADRRATQWDHDESVPAFQKRVGRVTRIRHDARLKGAIEMLCLFGKPRWASVHATLDWFLRKARGEDLERPPDIIATNPRRG